MTHINPDDPKWTAYALGELDGAERVAVEAELTSSEEARMLVEDLRFAAELTKSELREGMAVNPLTAAQREAVHAAAGPFVRPRRWFIARPTVWIPSVAAACIALLVLTLTRPQRENLILAPPLADSVAAVEKADQAATPVTASKDAKKPTEFGLRYQHPAARTESAQAQPPAAKPQAKQAAPTIVLNEQSALVSVASTGRIAGTVRDASGARIPGATITATNTQTGDVRNTATDDKGSYAVEGLATGSYKLTAALPGFRTETENGIQLAANTEIVRDVTLQVPAASQALEVAAVPTQTAQIAVDSLKAERQLQFGGISQGQQGQQGQQPQQNGLQIGRSFLVPASPAPPSSSAAPGLRSGVFDRRPPGLYNGAEAYNGVIDNPFLTVTQNPLSTFSIDVDTASYSNVRRFINQNQLPPRDAVRIEEMINYFNYDYPQPSGNNPVGATIEAASAPWSPQHRLVRVGIKARDLAPQRRPPSNLVFLLDVSGSMEPAERLPLLKNAIRMLVDQLNANDRVTVVTYAGTTGVALQPTRGNQKDVILSLINRLEAGGSTNGGSGIQLAYQEAAASFIPGGVNRVILATDGDFNVGITDRDALLTMIEEKARSGVFLTVLGVGMGNYKDATLEMLADKGHGNYAYLDTLNEARKVLVEQMSGTLVTMAKDVKVQVEFNPAVVDAYRLIGYENRALRNEDFNDDKKDAGDMGTGHTVTVLYEVVPRGVSVNGPGVDPLKYQQPAVTSAGNASNETMNVKIRFKEPTASESKLLVFPLVDREQTFSKASVDLRFAAAVAEFGMILRDSPSKGTATIDSVLSVAEDSIGSDKNGYRREFLQLVQRARQIRGQR